MLEGFVKKGDGCASEVRFAVLSWGRSKVTWCFIRPVNQYGYIRAKVGKKGKCVITMLVRSGLLHDQKNL